MHVKAGGTSCKEKQVDNSDNPSGDSGDGEDLQPKHHPVHPAITTNTTRKRLQRPNQKRANGELYAKEKML